MKINKIKIIAIALILIYILAIHVNVLALDDPFNPSTYNPGKPSKDDAEELVKIGGRFIGVLRNVGVAIAVVALSIIGLKYLFGSLEEKAEYQKTLLPWVIGAILIVASGVLVSYIYNIAVS